MWQNLGTDATPEWVALVKSGDLSVYATAASLSAHTGTSGNAHSLTGTQVRSILGVTTLSGSNTGDEDLSSYATTSAVAAGYVPRITSVDNRLTRFDGTTGAVQSSGITIDDSDNVSGVANLTASGNVGIGTTSPTNKLHVYHTSSNTIGGSYTGVLFEGSSSNALHFGTMLSTPYGAYIQSAVYNVSNQYPLLLNPSGGNVGLGTTSPSEKLHVVGNITASGTLRIGGGTVVANILSATATLDFPSIGSNDTETLTITVTGAVAGDSVFLGCPAGLDAGLVFCASVTAADTVTVRMHNSSGGAVDPASATFRATVIRF
jgi:hypothetical protein